MEESGSVSRRQGAVSGTDADGQRRARRDQPRGAPGAEPAPEPRRTSRRLRQIEAKRTAILQAALSLFSRHGLQGTTLDQIATGADLSKTNVLYYFATKEEIYLDVVGDVMRRWLEPLSELRSESEPEEAIATYIRSKLDFSRREPEASRLFCAEIVRGAPLLHPQLNGTLKTIVDEKVSVITGWVVSGRIAPVDPHHLIFSIWSTTQHYADFAVQVEALTGQGLSDPGFFEQTVAATTRLILQGVSLR